jgi:hypothetical protein
MDTESKYKELWHSSSAIKLLSPDIENAILYLPPDRGGYSSIGFSAYIRGCLDKLDNLMNEFDILKRGTKDFKNRLSENWLTEPDDNMRKAYHNTFAALCELVVADVFDKNGFKISNLSAWGGRHDVEANDGKNKYSVEIKFIDDAPVNWNARLRATLTGFSGWVRNNSETISNYYYSRIAEAVLQLMDGDVKIDNRIVWVVVSEYAEDNELRDFFEIDKESRIWRINSKGEYPGLLANDIKKILSKSPTEWMKESNRLCIATISNFIIKNIREWKDK